MVLDVQKPDDPSGLILESWAQGFMVGALIMMACVTFANMRRNVLLHKLILLEVSTLAYTRTDGRLTLVKSYSWACCMAHSCSPILQCTIGISARLPFC